MITAVALVNRPHRKGALTCRHQVVAAAGILILPRVLVVSLPLAAGPAAAPVLPDPTG